MHLLKFVSHEQIGFKKGFSISHNIFKVQNRIKRGDSAITFDLRGAFDYYPHPSIV